MTDILTKAQRSLLMSKVKSKDTGIEIALIKELHRRKIRNFSRYSKLIGKPDVVFERQKLAVFCDGDFWHGYLFETWKHKLNIFWLKKISNNMRRDRIVSRELKKDGWTVMRFWGHQILKNPGYCAKKIEKAMME